MQLVKRSITAACASTLMLFAPIAVDADEHFADSAAERFHAHTIRGAVTTSRITKIDEQWRVTFAGRDSALAPPQLVYWGGLVEPPGRPLMVLAAGSTLATDLLEVTAEGVTVGADPRAFAAETIWDSLHLPHARLRGVLLHPPWEDRARDQLYDTLLEGQISEHAFWLDNGDRFTGLIIGAELDGREALWRLRTAAGELTISHEKLVAVAWPSIALGDDAGRAGGVLGLRDGSRVLVEHIRTEGDRAELQLVDGITLSLAADALWSQIAYVRPPNQTISFASDLQPLGYRHVPFLNVAWSYGTDRNALGNRLRSAGMWFEKGLGVHSTSRLAYDVPKGAQRFQAELALDTSAGNAGSVVFRIYLQPDGGEWQQAFASPIVRGSEAPLNVDVDVSSARRLALIVEFADRGDEMDRANWLMARFVNARPAP
jgi:hypothetical protein